MKKAITVPVGESMVTFSVFSELQVAMKQLPSLHEKLDLHKFTRCKYFAKKCKLGEN